MNKLQELRNKRHEVWNQAKTYLEEKRREDGLVSAEDTAAYEKMEQEVVDLGKEIDRLERQRDMDMKLSQATSRPTVTDPMKDMEDKTGRGSKEYSRDFWNVMRKKNAVIPAILQSAMYLRKEPMQTADTLFRLNSSTPLFRRLMKTTSCVLSAARSLPHRTNARSLWQMATRRRRGLPRTVPTPRAIRPSLRPALTLSS